MCNFSRVWDKKIKMILILTIKKLLGHYICIHIFNDIYQFCKTGSSPGSWHRPRQKCMKGLLHDTKVFQREGQSAIQLGISVTEEIARMRLNMLDCFRDFISWFYHSTTASYLGSLNSEFFFLKNQLLLQK